MDFYVESEFFFHVFVPYLQKLQAKEKHRQAKIVQS